MLFRSISECQSLTSTAFYWPSNTKYHPARPHTDQYYQEPTSTAIYWPFTTKYEPVRPSTDQVPLSTNQYQPILTQYHQVSTRTASYWPSITRTNQYRPKLNQYYHVSNSTLYCDNKTSNTVWKKSFSHILFSNLNSQTFLCRPEMSTVVH